MNTARALGTALSLLDSELGPYSPYCSVVPWHFDTPSFLIGLLVGILLVPFVEVIVALRVWALRSLLVERQADRGQPPRPLYRLH